MLTPPVALAYGGVTGGYAYNAELENRRFASIPATFRTLAFCDAVYLNPDGSLQESTSLRGPGSRTGEYQVADQPWGFFGFNFTHFRHTSGMAQVAYLDGHVETVPFQDNVPDPSFCPPAFVTGRKASKIGFVSPDNGVYTAD